MFKLKCNNLIFNKIMILNASYACLLHSRFVENHPMWILKDEPLISEVVLSQLLPGMSLSPRLIKGSPSVWPIQRNPN
jgi:hypothetical protein